jgi:hypothetical protein
MKLVASSYFVEPFELSDLLEGERGILKEP